MKNLEIYRIKSDRLGLYLTADLYANKYEEGDTQKWEKIDIYGGGFYLKNTFSNQYLSLNKEDPSRITSDKKDINPATRYFQTLMISGSSIQIDNQVVRSKFCLAAEQSQNRFDSTLTTIPYLSLCDATKISQKWTLIEA